MLRFVFPLRQQQLRDLMNLAEIRHATLTRPSPILIEPEEMFVEPEEEYNLKLKSGNCYSS